MPQDKSYLGWTIDFLNPAGAPAFTHPDSMSWQIYKNPIALAIGGICAVLLEFADPRIRSGVWDHSIFKTDPLGRAQRTGTAAMVGVYGPREAAQRVIQGVNNMHAKVSGKTPDGVSYSALDTDLVDWVSATARYGFAMAYHQFVRPLSTEEMARYFNEGADVAKLYGVTHHVTSLAAFESMMLDLADRFEPHPINTEFLEIMRSGRASAGLPKIVQRAVAHAAIDILPTLVREKLALSEAYNLTRTQGRIVKTLAVLADHIPNPASPAAHACQRLGLPASFLWKSKRQRSKIFTQWQKQHFIAE